MSKRFTDTSKWKNEWFRKLSANAKLTWIYLCDECEFHGVIKMDWGLASFQLGFDLDAEFIIKSFGDKVHFLDNEKILIIPFFEFQYGDSKDSWSAKIKAKEKLENLGFTINNNKLSIPFKEKTTTVGGQWGDSTSTVLIEGISKGKVIGKVNELEKEVKNKSLKNMHDLGVIWNEHAPKELPKIISTSGKRLNQIKKVWADLDQEKWKEVFKRIEKSDWLLGKSENNSGWAASFDWVIKGDNYNKILEGNYDNRKSNKGAIGHLRDGETVGAEFDQLLADISSGRAYDNGAGT